MTTTKDYYGTKRVTAWPTNEDGKPGYQVKYSDGYQSWTPRTAFEKAYQPITAMNFGHALQALQEGHRVGRTGWNGKGMWIALVSGYPDKAGVYISELNHHFSAILPWLILKTVDNEYVPWHPSQTDLLNSDWEVIEPD